MGSHFVKRQSYADCMDELKPVEIYRRLLLNGLFSEKLPKVFTTKDFLSYCRSSDRPPFRVSAYDFASYYAMRNTGVTRHIGIPSPMAYEILSAYTREHWADIQDYFRHITAGQNYMVSRVHIRKLQARNALFELNYHNFKIDGNPEPDLAIGQHFLVLTDIEHFFDNIHLEQIAAALTSDITGRIPVWGTRLVTLAANLNNGKDDGLLIGPHISNLLSEILMCRIDHELFWRWNFIRYVDDYHCFVKTRAEAEAFIALLGVELENRQLKLNSSKTEILDLPLGSATAWPRLLQDRVLYLGRKEDIISRTELESFLDFTTRLMADYHNDTSIMLYALRILGARELSKHATASLARTLISLAFIYPYFVPLLGPYLFDFSPSLRPHYLFNHIDELYADHLVSQHYEACAFLLYYCVEYEHKLHSLDVDVVVTTGDCILLLLALIYCRHFHDNSGLKQLKSHALDLLRSGQMEKYWPFIYETLTYGHFSGDWRRLKKAGISFLHPEFRDT